MRETGIKSSDYLYGSFIFWVVFVLLDNVYLMQIFFPIIKKAEKIEREHAAMEKEQSSTIIRLIKYIFTSVMFFSIGLFGFEIIIDKFYYDPSKVAFCCLSLLICLILMNTGCSFKSLKRDKNILYYLIPSIIGAICVGLCFKYGFSQASENRDSLLVAIISIYWSAFSLLEYIYMLRLAKKITDKVIEGKHGMIDITKKNGLWYTSKYLNIISSIIFLFFMNLCCIIVIRVI